ncbi:hypothetical protein KCP70_02900 [Salmonella enterica subsp. enterica]|nr:hypothetical protein KCP70_02900 [Salmonella enterica subsp. enterica]
MPKCRRRENSGRKGRYKTEIAQLARTTFASPRSNIAKPSWHCGSLWRRVGSRALAVYCTAVKWACRADWPERDYFVLSKAMRTALNDLRGVEAISHARRAECSNQNGTPCAAIPDRLKTRCTDAINSHRTGHLSICEAEWRCRAINWRGDRGVACIVGDGG